MSITVTVWVAMSQHALDEYLAYRQQGDGQARSGRR